MAKATSGKQNATKQSAAKKGTAKKGTAKQSTAKKGTAKKSTAKKGTAKKGAAKQGAAKQSTAKKGAAKKSTAKQGAAKTSTGKTNAPKQRAARRSDAQRSAVPTRAATTARPEPAAADGSAAGGPAPATRRPAASADGSAGGSRGGDGTAGPGATRGPDLVLGPGDKRSRADWRTRSGRQPPMPEQPRSATLKMTDSKLVPYEDDTVEVGIRFPSPRGLLRRLFGSGEQVHEHRVAWFAVGGDDRAGLEHALADFMEVLGYHLASSEAVGQAGSRCCVFHGRARDRDAARRTAQLALRGALAQGSIPRIPADAARTAGALIAALGRFASGLIEFEGLLLVRIGEGGRAHVVVKQLAEG